MGSSTRKYLDSEEKKFYQKRMEERKKWLTKLSGDILKVEPDSLAFDNLYWLIESQDKIYRMRKIIDLLEL